MGVETETKTEVRLPGPTRAALGKGRNSQCGDCDRFFGGVRPFDKHLTTDGTEDLEQQRCMRTDEMIAAGMVRNANGVWMEGVSKQEAARQRAQRLVNKTRRPGRGG